MAKLTTRTLASGASLNDLIHIVITGDTSQSPDGSSYKAKLSQLAPLFSGSSELYLTGGTYNNTTGTATFVNNSGGTFTVTGFTTGATSGTEIYVTGGTSNSSGGTLTFVNNTGGTFNITGLTTPFTGGSTNCITDFYVTNVHGCSPITIMNETQFSGCSATINSNSFAQGFTTKAYAKFSNVSGNQSRAGTNKAYSATSVVNGVVTLASTYGNVTGNTEFTIGDFIYLNDAEYDGTLSANIFVIINTSYNGTSTLITINDNSQNTNSLTVLGTSVAANSQGGDIVSEGMYSSSRGSTTSVGYSSHSEGYRSESFGTYSHAEGYSKSLGFGSHSEGFSTKSVGQYSHSEGYFTNTYGDFSHAEGESTSTGTKSAFFASAVTSGVIYFDSGYGDQTSLFNPGDYLFLDDTQFGNVYQTNSYSISAVTYSFTTIIYLNDTSITTGLGAYVGYTGGDKLAGGLGAKSSGKGSTAFGNHSNTSGESCRAWSNNSMARGKGASAFGSGSFSNGFMTSTYGDYSYAEGNSSVARGIYSHAEGSSTQANGNSSHAEGTNSVASGSYSHAEGSSTASGIFSHAEGDGTTASGQYSHSQNKASIASGDNSHAGGVGSTSYGIVSFAHGDNCDAYGPLSVSLGGMNNFVNSGDTDGSAILGGYENEINYLSPTDEVRHSAIIGGSGNTVNSFRSAIIGGENNTVIGSYSVILGGINITGTGNETVYVPNIVLAYSGTPTSSSDTIGEPGSILWDDTYLYYKDNVGWKRISGSTF